MNLLIVEDQDAVREVIVETVRDFDGDMCLGQASSLAEARVLFNTGEWDGIVTDYNLGDGKSIEMIEELRNQGSRIPIIMVSGFLSPGRMRKAESLGVNHILSKPFNPAELQDCLRQAFVVSEHDTLSSRRQRAEEDDMIRFSSHETLLPKLFDMDRNQSLMFRIINDLPRHQDVARICGCALGIAMDIVHADRGFVSLFDRSANRLIQIAHQCNEESNEFEVAPDSCSLAETPFSSLLLWNEEFIEGGRSAVRKRDHGSEALPDQQRYTCWTDITADSFMAVPLRLQGVSMGVLCVMDSMGENEVIPQDRNLLGMLMNQLDTLLDNRAVHASLAASMKETLIGLVRSLEARDRYTKDHSMRVGDLSVSFARSLGLDGEHVELIRTGGLLHDIGKCGVPDAVLLKPGRYTEHEFAVMKAHPGIGDSILKHMDPLVRERQMVRHHHERMDGHGYPDRLKGEDIPFEARIVCVADAIDAMTTHRVYRMAKPLSFCLEQLKCNSGTQFDTGVVEVAIDAIEKGYVKTQAQSDGGDMGLMPLSAKAA